jgi:hypothetical protein
MGCYNNGDNFSVPTSLSKRQVVGKKLLKIKLVRLGEKIPEKKLVIFLLRACGSSPGKLIPPLHPSLILCEPSSMLVTNLKKLK